MPQVVLQQEVEDVRVLSWTEDPQEWWNVRSPRKNTLADLTPWLALTALVLFMADIALRESKLWRHERKSRRSGEPTALENLIPSDRVSAIEHLN